METEPVKAEPVLCLTDGPSIAQQSSVQTCLGHRILLVKSRKPRMRVLLSFTLRSGHGAQGCPVYLKISAPGDLFLLRC